MFQIRNDKREIKFRCLPNNSSLEYNLFCDLNKDELSWLVTLLELRFEVDFLECLMVSSKGFKESKYMKNY